MISAIYFKNLFEIEKIKNVPESPINKSYDGCKKKWKIKVHKIDNSK